MDVHLYLHVPRDIDALTNAVAALAAQVSHMDAATQTALATLSAEVNRETSLEQSVKTLLEGLAAQIEALKTNQSDPAVLNAAVLNAITAAADLVKANNDKFAQDVIANTP